MTKSSVKNSSEADLSAVDYLDFAKPVFSEDANHPKKGEKYIVFFSGENFYAISSNQIAEITQPLKSAKLPNTPEWFLGLSNLRGEIISVVDVKKLWNEKADDYSAKSKFIVLRADESAAVFALAVERLGEIITLSDEEIAPLDKAEKLSYLRGKAIRKSNTFFIMNTENFHSSLAL